MYNFFSISIHLIYQELPHKTAFERINRTIIHVTCSSVHAYCKMSVEVFKILGVVEKRHNKLLCQITIDFTLVT